MKRPELLVRVTEDEVLVFNAQNHDDKLSVTALTSRLDAITTQVDALIAEGHDLRSMADLRAFLRSDAGQAYSEEQLAAGHEHWVAGAAARKRYGELMEILTSVTTRLAEMTALPITPDPDANPPAPAPADDDSSPAPTEPEPLDTEG